MAEARTIFSKLPEIHLAELPTETCKALDQLEIEARGLDLESEIIGSLVNAADQRLRKIAPKIGIWLDDEIEPTKVFVGSHLAYQLGWTRVSDTEWGLAARVVEVSQTGKEKRVTAWHNISDPESARPTNATAPTRIALNQAPVTLRIAGLEKLPKLIQMLTTLARRRRIALETCRQALEQKP